MTRQPVPATPNPTFTRRARFSDQQHTVTDTTFQDVPPNAYYFTAVDWMAANAITTGCSSDQFCPNQQATRAQVAAFLHRYFIQ